MIELFFLLVTFVITQNYFVIFAALFYSLLLSLPKSNQKARAVTTKLNFFNNPTQV